MNCELSSRSVNLKDFDRICRLCLGAAKVGPIFETIVGGLKAADLLEYSVMVQVRKDDFLPQNICETCLNDLFRVYEFKKQCQENQAILKLVIENCTVDTSMVAGKPVKLEQYCDISPIEAKTEYKCNLSDCDNKEFDTLGRHKSPKKKRRPVYACQDCSETCSSKVELREHRRKVRHTEHRNHQCYICKKNFTRSKLKQHMRSHTKEKPYQCDECLQSFSMSGNLKRHKMTHTGERPHVCSICGKGFIQATSLHAHEKIHNGGDQLTSDGSGGLKFSCSFCGRGFKRLAPFNIHLAKHTSCKKFAPKETAKEDAKVSREHVCEVCARAYKTKHLLKAHQLTHGEKSYLCSDCGRGFVTKAALQSHLKVHTGEKPHTCVICKKSFAHVGSFDSHMLIHSGHKPYSCTYCPKSFTQLSHLTYHLRTHSGERPYSCSYCGKSFALKGNLTVHVRTHTGETPYMCPACGKGFYDSSSMKKHQRNHKEDGVAMVQQNHLQHQQVAVPQHCSMISELLQAVNATCS